MCIAQNDCGAQAACIAGRCQPEARVPVIQSAGVRRLVIAPIDAAFVRRGDASASASPVFALGRAADGDALLLLRFDVPLAPTTTVVEAYLLLDRSESSDADPSPIVLHASRIIDPWDARTLSWARQPRLDDLRSPSTAATPLRPLVRLDVRELVRGWRAHSRVDQGIAVVAENASPTGISFAFAPPLMESARDADRISASSVRAPPPAFFASTSEDLPPLATGVTSGPRLELYVK